MADRYSNSDGTLRPDGLPDDQAPPHIRAMGEENLRLAAAEQEAAGMAARNAYMNPGGGSGSVPGGLSMSPEEIAAAVSANDAALGNSKDDSFPVRMFAGTRVDPRVPKFLRNPQAGISEIPVNTLLKDGFLGVDYQPVIDKVAALGNNKTESFDPIYKAAVARTAYLQKTGTDTTVEKVLDQWQKAGLPDELKRLVDGSGGSGGPFSVTNRVVSLTDAGTARQVVNTALTRYLGREATDQESRAFLQALNVQERQNPTVTTTKGSTSGRNTNQTQTVTGGFDRNDFAERFAKSQEGYAEYQTATTYLDAFINALESDMRVI